MQKLKFILTGLVLIVFQGLALSQDKVDLLILHREYREAIQVLDRRIHKEPQAALYLKKGLVLNILQNYQEAIKAYTAGLVLEPGNKDIPAELADAYAALGNYFEANPYYEQAAELHPEDLTVLGKTGKNYIQLGEYQKAYDVFSKVYQMDSTLVYWNKQYAYCAYHTQKLEQAIGLFNKIIETNPGDYSSWLNLIRLYQQTENFGKKQRTIELAIGHFPGVSELYHLQANHFFGMKNYEEAVKAYDNYFVAGGDSAYKTMLNYGVSLYFSKNERKAIEALEFCADRLANDPYVLFYLSLSHKRLAEYELAQDYMNAAIESATPSYLPEMYHHLGQIYGQQRLFTESIEALKKANELDPSNFEALFEIATTYEEFNSNKTLALNYYNIYLREAGEEARNADYALERMSRIKEDMFFEE